jgi:hypothetical protein
MNQILNLIGIESVAAEAGRGIPHFQIKKPNNRKLRATVPWSISYYPFEAAIAYQY